MKINNISRSLIMTSIILVSGCGLITTKNKDQCQPGMECWNKLSPQMQDMKRSEWLGQRQKMLQDQTNKKINSLWAVKPVTNY